MRAAANSSLPVQPSRAKHGSKPTTPVNHLSGVLPGEPSTPSTSRAGSGDAVPSEALLQANALSLPASRVRWEDANEVPPLTYSRAIAPLSLRRAPDAHGVSHGNRQQCGTAKQGRRPRRRAKPTVPTTERALGPSSRTTLCAGECRRLTFEYQADQMVESCKPRARPNRQAGARTLVQSSRPVREQGPVDCRRNEKTL